MKTQKTDSNSDYSSTSSSDDEPAHEPRGLRTAPTNYQPVPYTPAVPDHIASPADPCVLNLP
eukprot:CAMPEP_0168602754 /NCGR_PEP_ID=MMETSP0420-20121227/14300_1 /TAXON_ID=498008 /ORGANISM="Pessonella sp." /LENGTH=61 /DNA_ID=CAMNT_0008641561 /DNA_START=61 /DNA_END=242 /DNA_ORIENTATION=+